jgi:hypothetical protein
VVHRSEQERVGVGPAGGGRCIVRKQPFFPHPIFPSFLPKFDIEGCRSNSLRQLRGADTSNDWLPAIAALALQLTF